MVTGYKHPSTRIAVMLWAHVASTLKINEKRICTNQIFTWSFNIIRKAHRAHTPWWRDETGIWKKKNLTGWAKSEPSFCSDLVYFTCLLLEKATLVASLLAAAGIRWVTQLAMVTQIETAGLSNAGAALQPAERRFGNLAAEHWEAVVCWRRARSRDLRSLGACREFFRTWIVGRIKIVRGKTLRFNCS